MNEHQVPFDFFRYTSYGLKYLCRQARLTVLNVSPTNGPLYTASRWVFIALQQISKEKKWVFTIRNILLGLFKFIFIPLCVYLEKYSTKNDFPQCWMLIAEKEGQKTYKNTKLDKCDVIREIICCPRCKSAALTQTKHQLRCCECGEVFVVNGDQIDFSQDIT